MGRTITLDDDVAEKLEAEAERSQRPATDVANEALRKALVNPNEHRNRFVVRPFDLGVRAGVNFDCAWKLLDEVEGPDEK
jgi:predicted transcriptional regulator